VRRSAPPAYAEDPASKFFARALDVYTTNVNLTEEERTIARYWADTAETTDTPPGHWIAILGQLARREPLSLMTAAEGFARVGLAVADAFISCWHTKYTYHLLRPETYITRLIDPTWLPLLITPGFPAYTSGHATQSGAAATVLTDMFGDAPVHGYAAPRPSLRATAGAAPPAPLRRRRRRRPIPGCMAASITRSTTTTGLRKAGASGRPSGSGCNLRSRGAGQGEGSGHGITAAPRSSCAAPLLSRPLGVSPRDRQVNGQRGRTKLLRGTLRSFWGHFITPSGTCEPQNRIKSPQSGRDFLVCQLT